MEINAVPIRKNGHQSWLAFEIDRQMISSLSDHPRNVVKQIVEQVHDFTQHPMACENHHRNVTSKRGKKLSVCSLICVAA